MTRYTSSTVARARELFAAGWTAEKIPAILEREIGVAPHPTTVTRWTNPKRAERYAENERIAARLRYRRESPRSRVGGRVSEDWKVEVLCELRATGMPFSWVVATARVWWAEERSEDWVRWVVRKADGLVA